MQQPVARAGAVAEALITKDLLSNRLHEVGLTASVDRGFRFDRQRLPLEALSASGLQPVRSNHEVEHVVASRQRRAGTRMDPCPTEL